MCTTKLDTALTPNTLLVVWVITGLEGLVGVYTMVRILYFPHFHASCFQELPLGGGPVPHVIPHWNLSLSSTSQWSAQPENASSHFSALESIVMKPTTGVIRMPLPKMVEVLESSQENFWGLEIFDTSPLARPHWPWLYTCISIFIIVRYNQT